ncbi:hypothetical protein ACN9M0_23550 [Streptomyces sp. R-07]|uniref:hypothetical protein n=1 Tax=unclassified Streptomyces TaxID=2593676 RepID=UPI003426F043
MNADPQATASIKAAQAKDLLVAVSNLTLIEARHSRIHMLKLCGNRTHVEGL